MMDSDMSDTLIIGHNDFLKVTTRLWVLNLMQPHGEVRELMVLGLRGRTRFMAEASRGRMPHGAA